MTEFRENLLTRMIHIYGFEHEITIKYANILEKVPQTPTDDRALEIIVESHEIYNKII